MIAKILSEWIRTRFQATFGDGGGGEFSGVFATSTGNPEYGDYQCNAAMALAKTLRKKPREIAEMVVRNAPLHESLERIEVAGAGFINMYLSDGWLANHLGRMVKDDRLGVPPSDSAETIVIDYSSPNVCKPMHIGHIRSMNIGNAMDRIFRFLGYRVISDNHLGDWGTQFGIIIMGFRNFLDRSAYTDDPVRELERVYVKSYEKSQEDDAWMSQCRNELVKLQNGDPENVRLWKEFVEASLKEFDRVYRRLGISFDLTRGESHYNDRLPGIIDMLTVAGLAEQSEGATVVRLDDEQLPLCIVRKSDGGFNYATTDIATAVDRVKEFKPGRIVYLTDERQQLHFKQIFAICRRLGYSTRMEHVWFGLMRLPDGVFSTRQGNVISLERLLDEAEQRALEIVKTQSPEMGEARQREVARAVGIGAVKYADLSQNPQTVVTFTWDKAMALDGNSGPYLQYTYARISSVADKYVERFGRNDLEKHPIILGEKSERSLATRIALFPETVLRAAETCKPNCIADYLFDLAQEYNTMYQCVPFLKAPEGIRESRVRLCKAVGCVLRKGLELLGIETPERI